MGAEVDVHEPETSILSWVTDALVFGYAVPLPLAAALALAAHVRWIVEYPQNWPLHLERFADVWVELGMLVPVVCVLAALLAGATHRALRSAGARLAGTASFGVALAASAALGRACGPEIDIRRPPSWIATAVVAVAPVWGLYLHRIRTGRSGTAVALAGAIWAALVVAVLLAAREDR